MSISKLLLVGMLGGMISCALPTPKPAMEFSARTHIVKTPLPEIEVQCVAQPDGSMAYIGDDGLITIAPTCFKALLDWIDLPPIKRNKRYQI